MDTPAPTLLMVEDDPEISRLAAGFLRREGFVTEVAESGPAMDALLARIRPDLIILDLMLPGEDGLAICRRLRESEDVPILILSAKSDEIDRVVGLEIGADDYLTKPFGPRELLARIRALLRRAQGRVAGRVAQPSRRFAFDRFVIDLDARALEVTGGDAVALTTAEFDLLACFARHPRRVLTRDQILDWTHGRAAGPFDRTVDMLISRLRRKLEGASPGSGLISTVRNGGYLLTAHVRQVTG
ncbi:response regulator [Rhodovarius lipocyclicus]|uniref:response regulator n=1 Tax=Rhodovarius lipocyclicus TaxID=268410 RepID=UPI0013577963|nr:response regulator transcription factor [Rhodovarius lipocyclicus]